jgi:hypothetical protein
MIESGSYYLPPLRRLASVCRHISIGWHERLQIPEEVMFNRASMELLQDWFLIYRDGAEIRSLIPRGHGTHGYFE